MNRLSGKVVLITGTASGIGEAHVEVLANEGAKLICADIQDQKGQEIIKRYARPEQAIYYHLDVSQEEQWKKVVAEGEKHFGKIDCLLNIAGFVRVEGIEAENLEDWNRLIAVNQTGVWLGMKHTIPAMRRAGGGSVVNIASLYGIIGSPDCIAYHAAKGAVRIMSQTAAIEYAKENIRVNTISPGIIDTPNVRATPKNVVDEVLADTPLGKMGNAKDIAYASVFLCSDECTFMTGGELIIDGGRGAK